jgi:predicted nucleic acid-binding protein
MPIVVDASIMLAPALKETHPTSALAFAGMEQGDWVVPSLWWFELRNVLVVSERRGRITEQETSEFLQEISHLAIIDRSPDEVSIMALARRHRLSVYDAAYLELALRERAPLATLDAALADAARREGVPVLVGTAAAQG